MTTIEEADAWIGRTAVDHTGEQIGLITQIWVDDSTGQPEWASVKGPALRGRDAIVPLAGTAPFGGGRRFAYSKAAIVEAPLSAEENSLGREDMERLSAHYGAPHSDPDSASWVDRLEDAADGGTVREITELLGSEHSAPPQKAPAKPKGERRFRRKSKQTAS
ncbi:MAG: PRC-barrel domain-containing protein [Acidimicrobiales bacterium]